jgi:hypothetical protein
MQMLTLTRVNPNPERSMDPTIKRIRKPKPQHLARSLFLIDEERGNVTRRTRERCGLLSSQSETNQDYRVDKATQNRYSFA